MTVSLHHLAMNVADPGATVDFYRQSADLEGVDVPSGDDGSWIKGPNFYLAIHPADAAPNRDHQVYDPGIGHFCLQSNDGDGLWDRLTGEGMQFYNRPAPLGTGAIYAYGRDENFNLVEVEGVPGTELHTPIWIAHVALVTPDIKRLADFYARLTGNKPYRTGRFDNPAFTTVTGIPDVELSAAWIKTPSIQLEMWQYHNPPTGPATPPVPGAAGYRHVGFCCDDIEAEITRLEESGIAMEYGESIGGHRTAWTADPDGTPVALSEIVSADAPLALEKLDDPKIVERRMAKA